MPTNQLQPQSSFVTHRREAYPADASAPRWYALRLMSRAEFRVADAIAARGFEPFLPTWSEDVRWSDRKKTTIRPLLPGYMLVHAGDSELTGLLQIQGVISILGSSLRPTPIDALEVENFRRVVSAPAVSAAPHPYVVGEAITVGFGPMAGTRGIVRRLKGETRLIVTIQMLQRAVSVEIDAAAIER